MSLGCKDSLDMTGFQILENLVPQRTLAVLA